MKESLNRCERNNNPLNIKRGSKWKGLDLSGRDTVFCVFIHPTYGFRAALHLIRKYIREGFDTPSKIISRWCPDSTSAAYIDFVTGQMKYDRDERLYWSDDQLDIHILDLVYYMAIYEGYRNPERGFILSAYKLLYL